MNLGARPRGQTLRDCRRRQRNVTRRALFFPPRDLPGVDPQRGGALALRPAARGFQTAQPRREIVRAHCASSLPATLGRAGSSERSSFSRIHWTKSAQL